MKTIILWLAMVVVGPLIISCSAATEPPGVLQGRVTIGPIVPVERPGEEVPIPPEIYAARKVMVYSEGGKRLIRQVDLDGGGYYRVELKPGEYTVDINRIGIDSSGDVPKRVEIKSGQTVQLDIDIDTGIR